MQDEDKDEAQAFKYVPKVFEHDLLKCLVFLVPSELFIIKDKVHESHKVRQSKQAQNQQ